MAGLPVTATPGIEITGAGIWQLPAVLQSVKLVKLTPSALSCSVSVFMMDGLV
jgi:hypothetical protein